MIVLTRINFTQLYYFYLVAKLGSIKAACLKINISQPSVSVQIKSFEDDLGFSLFNRDNKKFTLTEKGQILFSKAEKIFNLADEFVSELSLLGKKAKDQFRIGVLRTLSTEFINDFSCALWEELSVDTTMSWEGKSELIRGLEQDKYDFILTDQPEENLQRYTSIHLATDQIIIAASTEMKIEPEFFPNSLGKQNYLSFTDDVRIQAEVDYYFSRRGIKPHLVGKMDDTNLMIKVVQGGLCFCALPRHAVSSHLAAHSLLEIGNLEGVNFHLWGVFSGVFNNQAFIKKVINDFFIRQSLPVSCG